MKTDVLLIDAGTGNLSSVFNALQFLGYSVKLTDNPEDFDGTTPIILPGVGAFAHFMAGLRERKLVEPVLQAVQAQIPLLGICVGMQALFEIGEENGNHPGLGILPGHVRLFEPVEGLKIPQTGWNQVWHNGENPLLCNIPNGAYFYFNHSFYCDAQNPADIVTHTDYGIDYPSAVNRGNLFGVQFHPEKSQNNGLTLLRNFMQIGRLA